MFEVQFFYDFQNRLWCVWFDIVSLEQYP
jgi:hypothetical protein